MAIIKENNYGASIGSGQSSKRETRLKRVFDIILDDSHPLWSGNDSMGIIFYGDEKLNENTTEIYSLPTAKPLNRNIFQVPCINELVEIIELISGDTYYPELDGDPKFTTSYYLPPVSIHNNVGSNALPLRQPNKTSTSTQVIASNSGDNVTPYPFKKEFKNPNREIATKQLNNYLRSIGYTMGRSDSRAPSYSLFQAANGDYVFKLDDSADNNKAAVKLGEYYKENPSKRPVQAFEKDLIIQGNHGENEGQYIRMTATTPNGKNEWSSNVTDVEGDGNPTVGDPLIEMSVISPQTIESNGSRVILCSNQNLETFQVPSDNIDSLKSTYEPIKDPLETIAEPNTEVEQQSLPEPSQTIENYFEKLGDLVDESPPAETNPPLPRTGDPVFDALDEAAEAGLLAYGQMDIEDGDWDIDYSDLYGNDYNPEYNSSEEGSWGEYGQPPAFDFDNTNVIIGSNQGLRQCVYPVQAGKISNRSGNYPYAGLEYAGNGEFGAYRGLYSDASTRVANGTSPFRYHWGVDILPRPIDPNPPLLAIDGGEVIFMRGASVGKFDCVDGKKDKCGGSYGNTIVIKLKSAPKYAALYGHCRYRSAQVKVGDTITKGQTLAFLGDTGRSSGEHLHFEIIEDPTGDNWTTDVRNKIYNKQYKRNPASLFDRMIRGSEYDFENS